MATRTSKTSKKPETVQTSLPFGCDDSVVLSNPYCVITPMIYTSKQGSGVGRTYCWSLEEAIKHALTLLDNSQSKPEELYVVKVVRVVRHKRNHEVLEVRDGAKFY